MFDRYLSLSVIVMIIILFLPSLFPRKSKIGKWVDNHHEFCLLFGITAMITTFFIITSNFLQQAMPATPSTYVVSSDILLFVSSMRLILLALRAVKKLKYKQELLYTISGCIMFIWSLFLLLATYNVLNFILYKERFTFSENCGPIWFEGLLYTFGIVTSNHSQNVIALSMKTRTVEVVEFLIFYIFVGCCIMKYMTEKTEE